MDVKHKLIGLLILLIAWMYYWIDKVNEQWQKTISMILLVLVAYLVGRTHEVYVNTGRIRARNDGAERPHQQMQGGFLDE